ncbi:MAG: hypothetical protein M3Z37_00925 [Candidatus Eremiobacteraeota bacterium]|nr:hypothetical protein [Candidatus Eremiobacteraeota bacterium]
MQPALNLRPLSVGEMLDRAFHLYFKHFALFVSLLAVVLVPLYIAQYFQMKDLFDVFSTMLTSRSAGGVPTPQQMDKLTQMGGVNGWLGGELGVIMLLMPFAYAAVVIAMSRVYLGQPVTFGECYRAAGRRWLAMFMLIVLWTVVFILALIALIVFFALIGSAGALLMQGAAKVSSVAAVLTIIVFLAVTIVAIAVTLMLYMTVAMSFVAVVVERTDPMKAFSSGFARIFSRGQTGRSAAVALALFGMQLGITLVGYAAGGLAAYFLHSAALYVIVVSLAGLFFLPFAILTVGVLYYDIRIRREGFDLQMLADQMSATSGLPPPAPA